jgi:hypothetical protein
VRFLLNEMWAAAIARQLRKRGIDAIAATEAPDRYRGVPDHDVFARARADGRVIVTDNVSDFALLLAEAASRGERHPGVVFAVRPAFDRAHPRITGRMVGALAALARTSTAEDVAGGAVFLRPA